MPLKKRRYSDEQVATALAYVETAPSIKAAAEDLDIPHRTLHKWTRNEVALMPSSAQREAAKESLADRLTTAASKGVELVIERIDAKTFSDNALAGIIGMSIEKALLLRGEATSINQTLTEQEAIDRAAAIRAKALALRDAKLEEMKSAAVDADVSPQPDNSPARNIEQAEGEQ